MHIKLENLYTKGKNECKLTGKIRIQLFQYEIKFAKLYNKKWQ